MSDRAPLTAARDTLRSAYACAAPISVEPLPGEGCARWRVMSGAACYVLRGHAAGERDALHYAAHLTAFLAEQGLPCAAPRRTRAGALWATSPQGLFTLVPCLPGRPVDRPDNAHRAAVGQLLGRLHRIGRAFALTRPNPRGPAWWREVERNLLGTLQPDQANLLREELRFQALFRWADLPRGAIHGAPGPSHVLFDGQALGGVLGFAQACEEVLLYDLALAVNAWCCAGRGELDESAVSALLGAYHRERPWLAIERGAWPVMLRAAALSGWLAALQAESPAAAQVAAGWQGILAAHTRRRLQLPNL